MSRYTADLAVKADLEDCQVFWTSKDIIPVTRPAPSPLDLVVADAARKLLNLRMTNIFGEADEHDAKNLTYNLCEIWEIIDPMLEAIGDYAGENFNGIDRSLFKNVLRDALVGNATYEIESAGERIVEARREDAA